MEDQENQIQCPKEWVIERLRKHNLDYDYKTDALKKGDSVVEEALAVSFLRLDAREMDVEDIRSYIRDALAVYRHERARVELKLLTEKFAYVPTKTCPIESWVTAIYGKPVSYTHLTLP